MRVDSILPSIFKSHLSYGAGLVSSQCLPHVQLSQLNASRFFATSTAIISFFFRPLPALICCKLLALLERGLTLGFLKSARYLLNHR